MSNPAREKIEREISSLENMLRRDYDKYVSNVQTSEAQLEPRRVNSECASMESKLCDCNKGKATADKTTEGRMNDEKEGSFGVKYRNSETFSGDVSKLEEKRLSRSPAEKEKYKKANR